MDGVLAPLYTPLPHLPPNHTKPHSANPSTSTSAVPHINKDSRAKFPTQRTDSEMASTRRGTINGGDLSRRLVYGRPIPKRGQVKVAIVLGLAHSLASIFSFGSRSQSCRRTQLS
ncbi:unnamed protein product [Ilex paraguariensis]|uniref:Uncharacterized protein n=1 Tax=Ilex paraguariensis TaxID=185542 RepID=A0ABC8U4X7_9AQUA